MKPIICKICAADITSDNVIKYLLGSFTCLGCYLKLEKQIDTITSDLDKIVPFSDGLKFIPRDK